MKKEKNILMAVLAYCGPLIIVSYLVAKDDAYVKFHIKQSLSIIVVGLLLSLFRMSMIFPIGLILAPARLVLGIFMLIGIINAFQGKEKELPLIGKLAESFNF
jgi:uncharacterized membrane protein